MYDFDGVFNKELNKQKLYKDAETSLDQFKYRDPRCATLDPEVHPKQAFDYCKASVSELRPAFAAKFGDTWLTGMSRRGSFGELMAFADQQEPQRLLDQWVQDAYVIDGAVYVLTGGRGEVQKLQQTKEGYRVEPFYLLPNTPISSWKISDDSVLINTSAGAVIFNPESGLQMTNCAVKKS